MSSSFVDSPQSFARNLWQFSRPHTIIGTTLSSFALFLIVLSASNGHSILTKLVIFLPAWLACICGNVYIVGLNQLTDVAIDRINKPHLPLASGAFNPQQGRLIVALMGIGAILISLMSGWWLLATVMVSLMIGTAYSLKPFRLKRFPLFAAICILTVRGIVVNLGLFWHFSSKLPSNQLQSQVATSSVVWLLTAFIFLFTIAIAIFKDVPDLEGDRQYNIATFTLIVGKYKVYLCTLGTIIFCYVGVIISALSLDLPVHVPFFVTAHCLLLFLLGLRSREVDLENKAAIASFYQFIWQLFFLEYLLFPIACLIA